MGQETKCLAPTEEERTKGSGLFSLSFRHGIVQAGRGAFGYLVSVHLTQDPGPAVRRNHSVGTHGYIVPKTSRSPLGRHFCLCNLGSLRSPRERPKEEGVFQLVLTTRSSTSVFSSHLTLWSVKDTTGPRPGRTGGGTRTFISK